VTLVSPQSHQRVIPADAGILGGRGSRLSPGRQGKKAAAGRHELDGIPTYYDQPPLKASPWGWKVSAYIFIGGAAGAAQVIATVAGLADRRRYRGIVRNGRLMALAGVALGAPLLIADLQTPQRWYNMLRIFRPTSPMSIGTYVLTSFAGLSAVLAVAELRRGPGEGASAVERAAEIPAAVAGAAMSIYTGALLGATSTPLWAAAPRLIPALFGASAMASAAAALSLAERGGEAKVLGTIEAAASGGELLLLRALHRRLRAEGIRTRVGLAPLFLAAAAPVLHKAAAVLEGPAPNREPLPSAAEERRKAAFGKASAVAVLAGAFLLRHLILRAGNRSAERPRDYFRFTQAR